ncbi:hypothetical protein [Acetobacter persici]|uniref:hypothetical protein n=1 Tax=Acetobacter persici TaxID=1076596 RepID=UPI001BA68B34|nr:hypothetical protein [Acetobacter persici]MBS0962964.1 hypothetical protein [Acetobacter persici]
MEGNPEALICLLLPHRDQAAQSLTSTFGCLTDYAKGLRTSDAPTLEVVSPPDVLTAFQTAAAAQVVADAINKLWTYPDRRLFYVTIPFAQISDYRIGSEMMLFANVDGLRNGIGGLVVGESYRGSSPGEITFTVLV